MRGTLRCFSPAPPLAGAGLICRLIAVGDSAGHQLAALPARSPAKSQPVGYSTAPTDFVIDRKILCRATALSKGENGEHRWRSPHGSHQSSPGSRGKGMCPICNVGRWVRRGGAASRYYSCASAPSPLNTEGEKY